MLFGRPFAHIRADFGENRLSKTGANAIHRRDIDPDEADDISPDIEGWLIFLT